MICLSPSPIPAPTSYPPANVAPAPDVLLDPQGNVITDPNGDPLKE